MKLIVNSREGIIGEIEDYAGPVPRAGEYIFHPPLEEDGFTAHGGVMSVKSVTYGILTRYPLAGEPAHFTGLAEPYVEVFV